MPSVATVVIRGRDEASDEIKKVTREVGKLDAATSRVSGGPDLTRTLRGGAAATREMTQATGGLSSGLRSIGSSAAGLAGVFGVAFGAQAVVGFGQEALRAANSLEVTEARVRALSGSQDRYNQILAQARQGQQTYGGSLEENIASLGAFVNLSNRSGVAIEQLDNAARRLAAADPAQGIEGATVAMREFLTGTGAEAVTSLAERFELPKDALTALAQAGVSTADRMAGLDRQLNDLGYTNEFLASSTQTSAQSFERLSSAWSNFATAVGQGVATALEPAAVATTGFLTRLTNLGTIENLVTTATGERGAALQALLPQLLAAAEGSAAEEDAVRNLIGAYYAGRGAYADVTAGTALLNAEVAALDPALRGTADAAYQATLAQHGLATATQTVTAATTDATTQALLDEQQTRLQTQAKDELSASVATVVDRMIAAGDVSAATARAYAEQTGIAYELIAAQLQLADAYAIVERAARDSYQAQEILTRQGTEPASREQSRTGVLDAQYQREAEAQEAARSAAEKAATAARAAGKKAAGSARSEANKEAAAAERAAKSAAKAAEREAKAAANAAEREAEAAARAAEREAEAVQKAQDALLSDEERLAVYRERLAAGGNLPESERLQLVKEIRDLEAEIADEQERARRAAIDAQLAAIDDRKQRREEARELAQAQRVLASQTTSEAQKAAARDVIERIPLEQAKRAQEIADKLEQAGQAPAPGEPAAGATYTTMPVTQPATPVPVTIDQRALPPITLPPQAVSALGPFTLNATIVLPDGTTVGSGSVTTPLGANLITDLRLALRATGA